MARSKRLFQRILLLVDSSDAGMAAAARAIEIAKKESAALMALSVVDTDTLNMLLKTKIFLADERDEYERELEHHAEKYRRYVEKLAHAEGVKVEFQVMKGVVHRVVADAAKRAQADLIVMGTAKETKAHRSLLSRERQMILGEVECAVLLVPYRV